MTPQEPVSVIKTQSFPQAQGNHAEETGGAARTLAHPGNNGKRFDSRELYLTRQVRTVSDNWRYYCSLLW
jgi:hypothetical protein